jgi:hypothetical protein
MRRLCLILAILTLVCVLLTACTPDSDNEKDPTLPSAQQPVASDRKGNEKSESGPPVSDPAVKSDSREAATETPSDQPVETKTDVPETEAEFSGLDIEDEYSETVGEGVGVVGN